MGRKERQLLLVTPGEQVVLSPEIAAKAAQAMGAVLLQLARAEAGKTREGDDHDRRR